MVRLTFIVRHKPLSDVIEDFVIVEFQTVDTTMTGELNRAFQDVGKGRDVTKENYGFGLNWANVWKRCFIQMLNKGRVLERWGHKSFWVVQEPAYQYFIDVYGLEHAVRPGSDGTTVFMVYNLGELGQELQLLPSRIESTTITELLQAFGGNPRVPSKTKFVQRLERKSKRDIRLIIEMGD